MKYAKVLLLSSIVFTLFGCNQPSKDSQVINPTIKASNTPEEENSAPQQVDISTASQTKKPLTQIPQKVETTTQKQNNSASKYGTLEEVRKKIGNGRIIGSASCDGDGMENDVRVDYNGDGMPDECVTANLKIDHPIINEDSFQTVNSSLQSLAKGCEESKKTQGNIVNSICKKDGEIVKASESHAEFGDGIGYWFSGGKVVAAQRFHNGETFIFHKNGTLSSKFAENFKTGKTDKITDFNNEQIQDAKNLINGYQQIIAAFNNNSSTKAPSQSSIIDETSFQTVSKSLENITKGCTKTKKTEDNLQFEVCKKGDKVVSATEYAAEADAGSTYWFSPDGKLIAMRYFSSGDTYVFDSNYKVSSKFNVNESSKVNKISSDERKRIEEDSYFSYRRILDVFNL